MSRFLQWVKERYQQLDLLPKYFSLLFTNWQALLWGSSVLAVAWGFPLSWVTLLGGLIGQQFS
jgi:hypothetical protein